MKVLFITEGSKVSDKYKKAEKLVTIVEPTKQRLEEKITAETGMDFIARINQLMPNALILGWAGPSIKFVNEKIGIYKATTGDEIYDVLALYNQGKLKKYVVNYPDDACSGNCDTCHH